MSTYPSNFYADSSIEPEEVLEYVKENEEWFLEELRLGNGRLLEMSRSIQNILDNNDCVRRVRDHIDSKDLTKNAIELYEKLVDIKSTLDSIL